MNCRLEHLELIRYVIDDSLVSVLPSLCRLKTLSLWPQELKLESQVMSLKPLCCSVLHRFIAVNNSEFIVLFLHATLFVITSQAFL